MKILHTSDLHLGISLCGASLLKYQRELCESLCGIVKENGVDAVIAAGDIFDTSVATADAVRCWSAFATRLCLEMKIPLIVCSGNHDGAARLASCSELLKAAGLHISGTLEDAFSPVKIGNCEIYALPYYNSADAAAVLKCGTTADEVMTAVTEKILANADKSGRIILAAHCFAAGGKAAESDISARAAESVGGAEKVSLAAFSGFDYVALGHLHRAQTLNCNGTKIRYSGTPLPYSFGEAGQAKTVTIYDTDSGEISEAAVPQPYTLRYIEGEYDKILAVAEEDENRGDFMKIRLTDRYAGDNMFARLRELYPNLLHFSGMQSESSLAAEITAVEADRLDPAALAVRYSLDMRGYAPDEDEMRWLAEVISELASEL